jgi:hypothetical protein
VTVTEQRLRESLGALAGCVEPAPDAFERAHREWRRRDRRRRLMAFVVAVVVVAGVDVVGLWALESSRSSQPGLVFEGPAPIRLVPDAGGEDGGARERP